MKRRAAILFVVLALAVVATTVLLSRSSSTPPRGWPRAVVATDAWYRASGVVELPRGTLVTVEMRSHQCSDLASPTYSRRVGWGIWCIGSAQYPVTSRDAGRTWRIAGHYLAVVGVAGAGAEETSMLAALPRLVLAFSIGGNVVDVTTDGGRHWYSTAFPGDLVSRPEWPATTTPDDIEVAVTAATSVGARSDTAWYASTNQGRSWKLTAIS